jgi:hypothetical protein
MESHFTIDIPSKSMPYEMTINTPGRLIGSVFGRYTERWPFFHFDESTGLAQCDTCRSGGLCWLKFMLKRG